MLNSTEELENYQYSIITVLNRFSSLVNTHLTEEKLIPTKTKNSNAQSTLLYNVSDSDSDSDSYCYTEESTILWATEKLSRIELQRSSWNELCKQANEEVSNLETSPITHLTTLIKHMEKTHSRLLVQYAFVLSKLIEQRQKITLSHNEMLNLSRTIGQLKLESFESYDLALSLYKSQLNPEQHLMFNSLNMNPYQERIEEIAEMRLHPLVDEFIRLANNSQVEPAAQAIKDIIHPQFPPTNHRCSSIRGSIAIESTVHPTVSLCGLFIIHPGHVLNRLTEQYPGKSLIHELVKQHNSPEYNPSRAYQIYKSSEDRDSRYFIFDKAIVHIATGGKNSGIVQYYATEFIDKPIFEFEIERYRTFGLSVEDLFPLDSLGSHINSVSMTLTGIEQNIENVLNWRTALVFMLLILNKTGANPNFLDLMKNMNCSKNLDKNLDPKSLLTVMHNFLLRGTHKLPTVHFDPQNLDEEQASAGPTRK